MKALTIWIVGTAYVLAVLVGAVLIVWAADHRDNSANPTHWSVGAAVVLTPIVLAGVLAMSRTWILRRVAEGRGAIVVGAVVATTAALIFGAREIIVDANACGNQDCVRIPIPLLVACVLGAWSLPLGLSVLRRRRYPAPLTSVGMVAVMITLVAGLAAAVQRTRQEDDYADLALGEVLLVWVLPAVVAVAAVVLLHGPIGAAAHRTAAGRVGAVYLAVVGSWFVALPFAAGVDSDALPVLLAVAGGPGVALLAVGLMALVYRPAAGMTSREIGPVLIAGLIALALAVAVFAGALGMRTSTEVYDGPRARTPAGDDTGAVVDGKRASGGLSVAGIELRPREYKVYIS